MDKTQQQHVPTGKTLCKSVPVGTTAGQLITEIATTFNLEPPATAVALAEAPAFDCAADFPFHQDHSLIVK